MSASLVGSEMCIRDRLWRCHRKGRPVLGIRTSPEHTRASNHAFPELCTCLLYTSDAADDM
eukprot:1874613-Alexandrium_andersonii.AAC.1